MSDEKDRADRAQDSSPAPLILAANGAPFGSRAAAQSVLSRRNDLEPKRYQVVGFGKGFAIADVARLAETLGNPGGAPPVDVKPAPGGPAPVGGPNGTPRYWVVRFQARATENDPPRVELAVNGETLTCAREEEVILPEAYLEAADHAVYNVFEQMPGFDRKIIGKVKRYPYERVRESSKAEFDAMRQAGNQVRDAEYQSRALQMRQSGG